jgi:starvation-inducible outer membrane lipoprotein
MENTISFGTYNVPSTSINLSACYTAPSILPKEIQDKVNFADESLQKIDNSKEPSSLDNLLKGVLGVPKQ